MKKAVQNLFLTSSVINIMLAVILGYFYFKDAKQAAENVKNKFVKSLKDKLDENN